jgi:uncharacterized Zn finger protein
VFTPSAAAHTDPVATAHDERSAMASVAELVDEENLRRLADPIGYRQGVDLAVSGCVQLVSVAPVRVTARVEDLVLQHVELRATGRGLSWSCTCRDGGSRAPCKHSVAVAVAARQGSPSRRR